MQRVGNAEEIAETVLFLVAGPTYITGQIIDVDGGWSLS
jgi:NAD(P)-dependent dehydrogenase (short-subunit alcohol dehydrogenase family)